MPEDIVDPGDLEGTSSQEPEATTVQETPSERPRNPDGTFAAFEKHVEAEPDPIAKALSKHASYLVEAARDFGYSDEEIGEMSVNLLHKTMWNHRQQQDRVRQEALTFHVREQARVQHDPRPQPQVDPPDDDDDDFDLGVDTEELHPSVVKAMKTVGKGYKKEIKAIKGELAQRDKADRERSARRSVSLIDAAFNTLPEFKKLFGEGTGAKLGADSREMKRRIAVLREAGVDTNEPTSVPELRARIKEAAAVLFAADANPYGQISEPEKNGKQRVAPRISKEEWEEGALARPTQRKANDRPRTDKEREATAIANLSERMKAGRGDFIPDAEELDGFPE